MGKGSKSGAECKSASHQLYKDKAKNRVDDLQGLFSDLQSARKEGRIGDAAMREEQVNQILCEWKSELNEPSPTSSLHQEWSLGSFSSEIKRLLHLYEEEDDATSSLAGPKPEPDAHTVLDGPAPQGDLSITRDPQEHVIELSDQCKGADIGVTNMGMNNVNMKMPFEFHDFHDKYEQQQYFSDFDDSGFMGINNMPQFSDYQQNTCSPPLPPPPPPFAFLGPKCALWDCPRPALGLDWCSKSDDYCSSYHAGLAPSEGGGAPIVRPGGISLKDNLFFAALGAKGQGKGVGIPECAGAATAKSPWNAPELFDLTFLNGEIIREWLFFDKPQRAFESGNRKQRSLPDYNGRGWHESRKQVVNEFGGWKRSYYMDPQPIENFEWHLFEYEINKYNSCALYRLEVKCVEKKRSPKGKLGNDSVADLQKQMCRLTAEFPNEKQQSNVKGRRKEKFKGETGSIDSSPNALESPGEGAPCDYLVDDIDGYYVS